jgi:hypothetical protein
MDAVRNFFRLFGAAPAAVLAAQDPVYLFERAVEPRAPLIRRNRATSEYKYTRQNAMRRLYVIDNPELYRPPTPPRGYPRQHARVSAVF